MRTLLPLLLTAACTPEPQFLDREAVFDLGDVDIATIGATGLHLDGGHVVRGHDTPFSIQTEIATPPNGVVAFSPVVPTVGLCPPRLGGTCSVLSRPSWGIGSFSLDTDLHGTNDHATFSFTAPMALRDGIAYFQAGMVDPAGGPAVVSIEVLERRIYDRDEVCEVEVALTGFVPGALQAHVRLYTRHLDPLREERLITRKLVGDGTHRFLIPDGTLRVELWQTTGAQYTVRDLDQGTVLATGTSASSTQVPVTVSCNSGGS
jgi:hypothetical protein